VRQLDQLDPRLRLDERAPGLTGTIEAQVEHLDLATVIQVSQAVSGDIVLERLLETLMRTAIEQSGAVRGLLILSRGAGPHIAAEGATGDIIVVELRDEPPTATSLPETVVHYVLRSRESVILDDATTCPQFAADPYIRQRQARSLLCMPLLNQGQSIGVLYLENNLTPRVFAPARIAVLKLIAAQAAVSLENNRLYRELAEREARIRRLVDSNIIGVFTWRVPASGDGIFDEVNDEFLRMLQYDREDFGSGRVRRSQLTPPEWWERDRRTLLELRETGVSRPIVKEYIRKDGSRVPVLMGSACFDETRTRGVSFVLDLTERRRAEEALRETQMQLAHANRLETLGQLTASIAHEVNQPIAATLTNAQAGLRWLRLDPPDLDEARQSFDRIVRDGARAGVVVQRIRDLVKKAPRRDDRVEINAAIREVIEFTGSEALKNGVSVRTELTEGFQPVRGDRVELQQVILNLTLNAIEAMSRMTEGPKELLIATGKTEAGDILVAVRDSGPGLAPAIQENLFKAFYTTRPNGLGLGLSICRSIVETHGGQLWATANAPRGAVFQFTLPSHLDDASLG
jgi:PAS domain S-box-containing protein